MEVTASADRLQEKVAGGCLIAAPLLLMTSSFLEYGEGRLFAAGFIAVLAYICFIPALLGIARLLRQRAPRLSVFGGLLATVGSVGAVNFSTALLYEWAEREAGTPEATIVAITEVVEGRLFPVFLLFSILFPVSLLLLGAGLFRSGVAPKWVAVLLGVGAIVFPLGHILSNQLTTHLAELILLVPLVWIGVRYLTDPKPSRIAAPATG